MNRTLFFNNKPIIKGVSSIGGPKECSGSIGKFIDIKLENDLFGEKTFEKAETKMLYSCICCNLFFLFCFNVLIAEGFVDQ